MDSVQQFWRRFEETTNLWDRGVSTFPVRRNLAALRARHEKGDRNVIAYRDEKGNVERYKLEFTEEQRAELVGGYRAAFQAAPGPTDCEAEVFVDILESWGDSLIDAEAIKTPEQKTRTRNLQSFATALERVDVALNEIDSAALGWLYANIVDKLAVCGVQLSPADERMSSMKNESLRAQVEAGELRDQLRHRIAVVVEAAGDATKTLPKSERTANDPRRQIAKALERHFIEHGIEFATTETGFPAQCLRAAFELGGVSTEKVSYWLKLAADDPDSYARFIAMHNKSDGGNQPPV